MAEASGNQYFNKTAMGYNSAYGTVTDLRSFIFDERKRLVFSVFDLKDGKVLDAGCGSGVYTNKLSEAGYDIYGIDPSEKMIEIAQNKLFKNAKFSVGSVERLNFADGFFDGALCIGVLEYLPDPEAGIREIARVTRSGGIVILTAPNALSLLNKLDVLQRNILRVLYGIFKAKGIKTLMDYEYRTNFLNPTDIDRMITKNGLAIEKRIFHIFRLSFLNKLSPRFALWLSKKMNFASSPFIGINYIVKCKKI